MLTHGSLFSGIGGFELGAQYAGIETIWNCEINEFNRSILKKHFPNTKQYTDIHKIKNTKYVDIISGGFPYQDISIANVSKKNLDEHGKSIGIKGKRSGLWVEMWRVISQVRPKYVIIENSPMLLIRGFEHVVSDLSKIGYICEWQCLQAAQFGYNHKRERIYCIAYPNEKRCKNNHSVFTEFDKIYTERPTPRQSPLSIPIKRFNSKSIYDDVRVDDGLSEQLDKRRIEALGNAVIPEISHYLFECIKIHYKTNY